MALIRSAPLLLAAPLLFASCAAIADGPPADSVPLSDLEEPATWRQPPDDEGARTSLALGSFTGIQVSESPESLARIVGSDEGVLVERVVENSPAVAAGVQKDDLLLEAWFGDAEPVLLEYPSQWRKLELDCPVDGALHVVLDRGGVEQEIELKVTPRLAAPGRDGVERLREEDRVGVVIRTATEVEARAAGLGPGGGAVVVGLAKSSPWRDAGVRFGDLVVEIDGQQVAHPNVVIETVRESEADQVRLIVVRDGQRAFVDAPLSERESETTSFWLPPLYSYEKDRDRSSRSFLLGMFRHEATDAAWDFRMFWLFRFAGGDADVLEEVDG